MIWRIVYSHRASRDLRSLDPPVARRVLQALDRLAEVGQGDLRRLQGAGEELRLRVGDWRIRLVFETEYHTIRVFQISHRSQAYRR